jgi:hypothetical protein
MDAMTHVLPLDRSLRVAPACATARALGGIDGRRVPARAA